MGWCAGSVLRSVKLIGGWSAHWCGFAPMLVWALHALMPLPRGAVYVPSISGRLHAYPLAPLVRWRPTQGPLELSAGESLQAGWRHRGLTAATVQASYLCGYPSPPHTVQVPVCDAQQVRLTVQQLHALAAFAVITGSRSRCTWLRL